MAVNPLPEMNTLPTAAPTSPDTFATSGGRRPSVNQATEAGKAVQAGQVVSQSPIDVRVDSGLRWVEEMTRHVSSGVPFIGSELLARDVRRIGRELRGGLKLEVKAGDSCVSRRRSIDF